MNAHVQFVFHRLFLRRKALLIYPMLSYVHWWQRKNAHKLKLNLAKIFHMRIFSNQFFFYSSANLRNRQNRIVNITKFNDKYNSCSLHNI